MRENKLITIIVAEISMDGSSPAPSNLESQNLGEEKRSIQDEKDIEKAPNEDAAELQVEVSQDPNIVSWDGPDDPENPLNWTKKRKVTATISIALITLLTYELIH